MAVLAEAPGLADLVLAAMVVETAWLIASRRATAMLLFNLAAGAALVLALRVALAGQALPAFEQPGLLAALALSLVFHVAALVAAGVFRVTRPTLDRPETRLP